MNAPAPDPAASRPTLTLYAPPPPAQPGDEGHGGLKLDWHSDVGRTGALLEWRPVGRGGDAGVPPAIALTIAMALCTVGTVAGCTLDVPDSAGPAWEAVPLGHACRFAGRWWPRSTPIGLLASREPIVVARLFDDDAFPWALETQALFVAAADTLPRLDRALVEGCLHVPIRTSHADLQAAGVAGLLVAGVDGDVAGLYAVDPGWQPAVERALAEAVDAAGGRWQVRDGAEHWSVASVRRAAGGPGRDA